MKVARIAAVAISIAAAIPTGGTTLLGAALWSTGAVGIGAAAAVGAGVAAAANIGAGLLAKKPSLGSSGSQTQWKADPGAAIPIKIGRTGGGGEIRYRKGSGAADNNEYQTLTTVLSLGPCAAIEASYADKNRLNLTGTAAGAPYSNWMWEDRQLGLCPEATALNTGVGNKPGWTAAHKLSGLCAVQNTLRYDAKGKGTFMTEPQMLWVGRWVLCYDPRKDSTYPGGSGPQRINDQSTWAWSNNPPVVGLTYAIGWFQNGKRRGGVGMPIDDIDIASAVECANICDLNGWTIGGEISTGDNKWSALKAILQAGGCEPIRDGATLSFIIQAPRVSIASVGAGDLVGKASVPRSRPRKERINGIIPKYRSEAHWWEQVTGSVARIAEHVAADGATRTKTVEYPLVQVETGQDTAQPTQLAGYDVELSRERMPIVLPLKTRWIGYRTGDCIDCPVEELGLDDVQLIIVKRSLDAATGMVTLTCRTEDPGKHARVFALTGDLPPVTTFERPIYPGVYSTDRAAQESLAIANSWPVGMTIEAADTGTITISDHVRRYPDGFPDVAVTGAVLDTGLAAGEFRAIYYDDFDRAGGAVAYGLTADDNDARVSSAHPGRHYVGYATIPTAGSPPSGGGGASPPGGSTPCVVADTPILFADGERPGATIAVGDRCYTRHEFRLSEINGGWGLFPVEAVLITDSADIWDATIGGKYVCGTGPHRVWPGSWQRLDAIGRALSDDEKRAMRHRIADMFGPDGGGEAWRRWYAEEYMIDPDKAAVPVVKVTVTDAHTYVSNGVLSHNIKQITDN